MKFFVMFMVVLLFLYLLHLSLEFIFNKLNIKLLRRQQAQFSKEEPVTQEIGETPKPVMYELQTHKIRYWFFKPYRDLQSNLATFYENIVRKYLWINEPFHSIFYKTLLFFDKNKLMIIDPDSRVVTMNLRDANNKMHTSKSYQVFSTRDIVQIVIEDAMSNILRFAKNDAQAIVFAICIIALNKSMHYVSKETPQEISNELLNEYKDSYIVKIILGSIKDGDSQFAFVEEAFSQAFKSAQTFPYNDRGVPRALQIPPKLPSKFLQEI